MRWFLRFLGVGSMIGLFIGALRTVDAIMKSLGDIETSDWTREVA